MPYEKCPVALRKFENKTAEFVQNVYRFGKLPCIVHGDFKLAESIAIIWYLSREFQLNERCAQYFLYTWIIPQKKCLDLFEREWLDGGRQPFVGGKEFSYADVVAACEVEQPKLTGVC